MANAVRVRVSLENKFRDPVKNFKEMMHKFRRRVGDAGIKEQYKEHQVFMSKSEKRRKKKREAIARARENMIEEKMLTGEPIKAPAGLIKKVASRFNAKKKDKDKDKDKQSER